MTTTADLMDCAHGNHDFAGPDGEELTACRHCGYKSEDQEPQKLEFRKALVLSTGHVSAETRKLLESDYQSWPFSGGPILYGWYVYAHDEDCEGNIPPDMWACMEFARKAGADYLQFDADGPVYDGLFYEEF